MSNSLTGLNLSETIMINVNSMKDNCLDLNLWNLKKWFLKKWTVEVGVSRNERMLLKREDLGLNTGKFPNIKYPKKRIRIQCTPVGKVNFYFLCTFSRK